MFVFSIIILSYFICVNVLLKTVLCREQYESSVCVCVCVCVSVLCVYLFFGGMWEFGSRIAEIVHLKTHLFDVFSPQFRPAHWNDEKVSFLWKRRFLKTVPKVEVFENASKKMRFIKRIMWTGVVNQKPVTWYPHRRIGLVFKNVSVGREMKTDQFLKTC